MIARCTGLILQCNVLHRVIVILTEKSKPMYCVDVSNDAHWLCKLDFFIPTACVFMMLPYGLILPLD